MTTTAISLADETALAAFAARCAAQWRAGDVVALWGDLGAGKTSFVRAALRALTHNPALDVPSPTFTLLQDYETPELRVYHYDLYRLAHPDDVYELGFDDARQHVCLIEWPDRLGTLLPDKRIDIHFAFHDADDGRSLTVTQRGTI